MKTLFGGKFSVGYIHIVVQKLLTWFSDESSHAVIIAWRCPVGVRATKRSQKLWCKLYLRSHWILHNEL